VYQLPSGDDMKGIVLAGGRGTRLYPLTLCVSKQILPVHDKPMIYYPISVLMLAGIREILIISTERDIPMFKELLGDGSQLGMKIEYAVQQKPSGLAEAFIIGEEFIGDESVCLILGDNIIYGHELGRILTDVISRQEGATIFGYYVSDPTQYGVVDFDNALNVLSLEEKPVDPDSNYAVVGLYFYDNTVAEEAKRLSPSARGELEISDLNKRYLEKNRLRLQLLYRGIAWLDTGTQNDITEAAMFVKTIEERQGLKIACLEEIAYRKRYISREQLLALAEKIKSSEYGQYLYKIGNEKQWT